MTGLGRSEPVTVGAVSHRRVISHNLDPLLTVMNGRSEQSTRELFRKRLYGNASSSLVVGPNPVNRNGPTLSVRKRRGRADVRLQAPGFQRTAITCGVSLEFNIVWSHKQKSVGHNGQPWPGYHATLAQVIRCEPHF
jgi:hypothetical protein